MKYSLHILEVKYFLLFHEIEDLKKIKRELRQCVIQLLDKKQVVESQVDKFSSKNDHLCKLVVIGKLSELLEK